MSSGPSRGLDGPLLRLSTAMFDGNIGGVLPSRVRLPTVGGRRRGAALSPSPGTATRSITPPAIALPPPGAASRTRSSGARQHNAVEPRPRPRRQHPLLDAQQVGRVLASFLEADILDAALAHASATERHHDEPDGRVVHASTHSRTSTQQTLVGSAVGWKMGSAGWELTVAARGG